VNGLDTNVLARYLTEDEPVQSKRAADWIGTITARGERCFISAIVLCELAWVLRSAYRVSQADLILTLDRIPGTTQFIVGDKDIVRRALDQYRAGRADFADYVIGALHQDAGCRKTVTFDRRLRGHQAFQVL
jgi:predicted nucleic-acid-binding protein